MLNFISVPTTAQPPANLSNSTDKIIGRITFYLLLTFGLLPLALTACNDVKAPTQQIEFQQAIGAKIEPELLLVTSKSRYNAIEDITFQGINRTDRPIYFADYSMGVKAFQYDQQSSKWMPIDIGSTMGDPLPLKMESTRISKEPYFDSIPIEFINGSGAIRLSIIGWTDPSSPTTSIVANYQDIYIDKTNPRYIGVWEKAGSTKMALPDGNKNFLEFDFDGTEIGISFSKGPIFGAAEILVDGKPMGQYCNHDAKMDGNNDIILSNLGQTRNHRLEVFPKDDDACNPETGYTKVLSLEPH